MRTTRRTSLARVIAAHLITLITLPASAGARDLGPFESMTGIPDRVDAAAVFDNPAEAILLSPVGRSMRSMLALGGVFTQTENAWGALARTFNEPVDDTIRALLSDQVAVVWDGLGAPNDEGMSDSFDSHWTLICKVDPSYPAKIRQSLRPVKREIVHNRAVYAIEQGRYALTIIDPPTPDQKATVLLAPRSGTDLLRAVLEHAHQRAATDPITMGHEPMLAELGAYHESLRDGSWSFVFMSRLDIFRAFFNLPQGASKQPTSTLAGIVKLDPDAMRCTFASNLQVDPGLPDAPIELFDAIASESVFTIASARAPSMGISGDSFSLNLTVSSGTGESPSDPIFDAPALLALSPGDAQTMSIASCFVNPRRDPGQTAAMCDETVRSMIHAFDPSQASDFGGKFPLALRQLDLNLPTSDERDPRDWPSASPSLAWKTTTTSRNDLVIASIAPTSEAPSIWVKRIEDSARTLDALAAQPRSGVLLRVSMDPSRTLKIVNDPDIMDIALARIIHRFDMGIRRGIDAPIRGRLEIQFSESASSPKLGNDAP